MNNATSNARQQRADGIQMISPSGMGQRSSIYSGDENPCRPTLYTATGKVA
jgi:hypothetical protein